MVHESTLEEIYSKNIFPYKVWYILLEDVNYTADTIFNISHKISLEPFYSENLMKLWELGDYQVQKRVMYNIEFLERLEDFLIKNGIYFNWIKYEDRYIGIRIQPSLIDFNGILKDCMTFEEFSWNRHYMNIPDKELSKI